MEVQIPEGRGILREDEGGIFSHAVYQWPAAAAGGFRWSWRCGFSSKFRDHLLYIG